MKAKEGKCGRIEIQKDSKLYKQQNTTYQNMNTVEYDTTKYEYCRI